MYSKYRTFFAITNSQNITESLLLIKTKLVLIIIFRKKI